MSEAYTLPELTYAYDALQPHIDAQTMEIHHTKHHQAYINKLNDALGTVPEFEAPSCPSKLMTIINTLPEEIQTAVRNNGGGHANHSLFWKVIAPGRSSSQPTGELAEAVNHAFGSFEEMKETFNSAALNRFGSGWAWLTIQREGILGVVNTINQDNPLMGTSCGCKDLPKASVPIMGLDVWEHAYYLNYQNRRPDYVNAFWDIVNWDAVSELYAANKDYALEITDSAVIETE